MATFTRPTGFSMLLKAQNKRLGIDFEDPTKSGRAQAVNKQLKVKSKQNKYDFTEAVLSMKTGSESHETESRDGKYSYRDIQNT